MPTACPGYADANVADEAMPTMAVSIGLSRRESGLCRRILAVGIVDQSGSAFAVKAMKHHDVYASYFMIIPDKFVKTFLPKESRKMTLWDPQAKPWKVWYEYTGGECPRAAFSAGWGALAMENNLEKWDVCVFELLDQEYNIKLHVHRVILMITPCVIAPKPRTYE